MKVKVGGARSVFITGEYIKLDSLLKFASIASTGGEAKYMIQNGDVFVDKEVCTARGKKIKPGSVVRIGNDIILVKSKIVTENENHSPNGLRSKTI